jgi:adenine-specific DNA-methyltransferase
LPGGFTFETTGKRVNREVILELEREAIASLVLQTDITGAGRGITKLAGKYIVGKNARNEALALCWAGRTRSTVDRATLTEMFNEAKALGLNKPLRVYGTTCTVGETESFRFCQIPDELLAALQLTEGEDGHVDAGLGLLEAVSQPVPEPAR